MKIYNRERWGARRPNGEMSRQGAIKEFFLHWSAGRGAGIANFKAQCEAMRQIQAYHIDGHGWSDIGYYYVVFQPYGRLRRARVFEGRSQNYVPAAQLNHNYGTFPVCVVMAKGEKLKGSTKAIVKELYKRSPATKARGHSEVFATECPGPLLTAFLPELRKVKR